jgi:hypothetical protein
MTYLQLVNNVLRRMREDEVTSVNQNTYSKMVGDFVNDAQKIVADAWDWSQLRQVITINTVAGTSEYLLSGANYDSKILTSWNDTSNLWLEYQPTQWIERAYFTAEVPEGSPMYYTNYSMTSGEPVVKVYPEPNDVYTLVFNVVVRDVTLTNNTDVVLLPTLPIIHLAVALLARERGETGGTATNEYLGIADRYLSDAIAHDANRHPEELVWNYV